MLSVPPVFTIELLPQMPMPMTLWLFQSANSTRYKSQTAHHEAKSYCPHLLPLFLELVRAVARVILASGFEPVLE